MKGIKRIRLRKYREVARIYIKAQLAWRADVVFSILFNISRIIFAFLLWGIVFTDRDNVAGFTFHGMMSYYLISSLLNRLEMSDGISGEISSRIRNGTFSRYMVIPVSIEGYFTAMEAGVAVFYLGFELIAMALWIFVFQIRFVIAQNAAVIAGALLMAGMGMFFMVLLNYYLGILTLKYEEISTFLMIKNNLVSLVTGGIVPLVLFPEAVVKGMRLLPFYYVTYLPSMLLTGRCENEMLPGMVCLGSWCIVLQALIVLTWKKYRKKYDGVGI